MEQSKFFNVPTSIAAYRRDEAHVNVEDARAPRSRRIVYLADRERRTVDNSSPATGGFPAPARFGIRRAFATFPLAARSAKYSSVRKADTFSATATLINWFMATPSALATFRASSINDGCSLNAKLLFFMNVRASASQAVTERTTAYAQLERKVAARESRTRDPRWPAGRPTPRSAGTATSS